MRKRQDWRLSGLARAFGSRQVRASGFAVEEPEAQRGAGLLNIRPSAGGPFHRSAQRLGDHDGEAEADFCRVPEGRGRPSHRGEGFREIYLSSPGERALKTELSHCGRGRCGGSELPRSGDVQAQTRWPVGGYMAEEIPPPDGQLLFVQGVWAH